jgi:hypothetical protein
MLVAHNVSYQRVGNISEWAISHATRHLSSQHQFSSPSKMPSTSNESRVILALQALQNDRNLSVLAASKIYNISRTALLTAEVSSLRKANEALSKRKKAKRTRVQLGGSLTLQAAMDLLGPGAVGGEAVQGMQPESSSVGGVRTRVRCCGVCGKPGHNARTCQEAAE